MAYSSFDYPEEAQANDIEIINGALALAGVLVTTLSQGKWVSDPFVAGIAKTIREVSKRVNHTDAGHEIWKFGAYVSDTTHVDDLDGLISDYLSSAATLIKEDF